MIEFPGTCLKEIRLGDTFFLKILIDFLRLLFPEEDDDEIEPFLLLFEAVMTSILLAWIRFGEVSSDWPAFEAC